MMESWPEGARLRVWTAAGGHELVGSFTAPMTFRTENGRCTMSGVGYCRIEDADSGHVYYDNGTLDDFSGPDFDDERDCTHCGGEGTCDEGSDPLGNCPEDPHRCHACAGSGRRADQTIF